MNKREFNKLFKRLLDESRDGFFGYTEMRDEIWYHYDNEQLRSKYLWKEVQRLRKSEQELTTVIETTRKETARE